jgi:hypothetical protein
MLVATSKIDFDQVIRNSSYLTIIQPSISYVLKFEIGLILISHRWRPQPPNRPNTCQRHRQNSWCRQLRVHDCNSKESSCL